MNSRQQTLGQRVHLDLQAMSGAALGWTLMGVKVGVFHMFRVAGG